MGLEAHMYASQWFLTLFTAKFPLYMVFHIIDLLLCEVGNKRHTLGQTSFLRQVLFLLFIYTQYLILTKIFLYMQTLTSYETQKISKGPFA